MYNASYQNEQAVSHLFREHIREVAGVPQGKPVDMMVDTNPSDARASTWRSTGLLVRGAGALHPRPRSQPLYFVDSNYPSET